MGGWREAGGRGKGGGGGVGRPAARALGGEEDAAAACEEPADEGRGVGSKERVVRIDEEHNVLLVRRDR